MFHIIDPRVVNYISSLRAKEDPALMAMEEKAQAMKFPIIDRQVGQFLHLITLLKRPKLVVELGSGFGYSALWIARALEPGARIVLTDYAEKNMDHAREIFSTEGLACTAEFRTGNSLELGQDYDNIDLLFIDMDKYLYPQALEIMLPRLTADGLVVADNALWRGRVVENDGSKDSEPIRRFNELMCGNKEYFATVVPVGDGLLLAARLT
ncbi:O-methyltransferase [Geotalea sp. SG265]|uniref:O-methyltransferase n=1 Tax=Geotalea sp. SG265 TaxID=2922867 RepID=UPI001FB008A6|nr:O-methyltransferase [Geotalea sp. SG265]